MDLTSFDKIVEQRRKAANRAARTHTGKLKALNRVEDVDDVMENASDTESADGSGGLKIEDISSKVEDIGNDSNSEHDGEMA
jgi:hypothetical protein